MFNRKNLRIYAVQRIRSTVNEREQKQLLMDLDVVMRSNECPYIVKFYGALFKEVCICVVVFPALHYRTVLHSGFGELT